MTDQSYTTDSGFFWPSFPLPKNPAAQLTEFFKTMTQPFKMRPEVAYSPWEDRARELLVAEMGKRRITYKELARRLEAYGIDELPDQINRKVNRKRFSAAFLLACLAAMEVESVVVPDQLGRARAP